MMCMRSVAQALAMTEERVHAEESAFTPSLLAIKHANRLRS